jgi:thiol-disulfide isomerase/thioredoxin
MRKNTLLYFSFIFILGIFTTENLNGQLRKTIVYGKITNQSHETPKVITVIACDPLADNDRFASRVDSSGIFRASFEMLWGHSFTINYDKQFINLYANPGDSIYIEIDADKFHKHKENALTFGGDNSQKNAEFSQAFDDLCGITKLSSTDFSLPLTAFMKSLEADNNKINDSIAHYCREQNMSSWTQNLMQEMALYTLANYAMDYKGRTNSEALEFYTQPIFDIYNPKKFSNMMFSYHIKAFQNAIFRNDSLMSHYLKNKDTIDIKKRGSELLMELPKSLTRDVLLFYFYQKIEYSTLEIGANDFTNKAIFEKVLALRNPQEAIKLSEIKSGKGAFFWSRSGIIENVKDFCLDYLIREKYKGKVIYMDIWATWCGPCRAEMAPARELHKLFLNKDVVFLNICMKSTQEAWAKMVKNGEIEGENYFFDDDLSSEASASLLSGGYPTFVIIGKDGKVRTKNAPRPSSSLQVCDEMDKLLAE